MSWGPQTNPNGTALTGRRSRLPAADDLAAMVRDGQTAEDIGAEYGVAPTTVDQHLKRAGYHARTGRLRDETAADVPDDDLVRLVAAAVVPGPWVEDALCAQVDSDMFFPDKGSSTTDAKAVCARCPVRDECLDYALANNERFGIWGGTSERDRRRLTGHTSVKTCPQCGEHFTVSTGSNSVTYCGGQCRRAARARTHHDSYVRTRSTA